ncbi:MAG: helix-turn-helix transcriptional regulator [Clostridia bacterium]|nr:helix-turn-helix transcriptional regulator [Clostridia bacterium]
MDALKIGNYIKTLRKTKGLTQKDLAEKLSVSFQAVSKWENGETLPDTGLLTDLCDILDTTADKLLNGGVFVKKDRKLMRVEDVVLGFEHIEDLKRCFGENCTFYTGMIDGINSKMNIDLRDDIKDPALLEVMWAEVLVQGILSGRTVDMDEVRTIFSRQDMIDVIDNYARKAAG